MTTAALDTARPGSTDTDVHFGLVELDLLATHAGVPLPFPLRVPSFGRIAAERAVLLDAAGHALRSRGLAGPTGPTGAAAELVAALRDHRGTVDLVISGPGTTIGAVAMVYGSWALMCRQSPAGGTTVRVRRVPETALAAELRSLVPGVRCARSIPITLPAVVVDTALRLVGEATPDLAPRLRALMRDHGRDPAALDELAGLLPALVGRGQLGATRRDRGRAGTELSWLDGPRGRVRVHRAPDGWVSVNPLRQDVLRLALDELATIARERR